MDIKYIKELLSLLKSDYLAEAKRERPSKRWLQDFNEEIREIKSYRGREILELLQNADDAQSDIVTISLDTRCHTLKIKNSGLRTQPFTEEGIESIMFANLSPKSNSNLIGAKGLGFRSILNWTNSIKIKSGNVKIKFDSKIVEKFWKKSMAVHMKDACFHQRDARNNNRAVPIAILTMPEIKKIAKKNYTEITLYYNQDREEGIVRELDLFKPKSLLFLHNIKSINIQINDEPIRRYEKSECVERDGIIECELMGEQWVIARDSGEIEVDNNIKNYEIACAFCMSDASQNIEPIFDFFPTMEDFGIPCLLHATLELDSSRNYFITESANNREIVKLLPDIISRIAEYIKTKSNSWDAYRLMRPTNTLKITSEYVKNLYNSLTRKEGKYIPTIGAGYVEQSECFYFNDALFDIIHRHAQGKDLFAKMRLKMPGDGQLNYSHNGTAPNAKAIEAFAAGLGNDYEALAEFIIELSKYLTEKSLTLNCHIFLDGDDKPIEGRTYINGGEKVESIPSFLKFNYINENLEHALKKRMTLKEGHPDCERDMASKLNCIGEISSSDITYIVRNILPKSSDASRSKEEQEELLTCLFNVYRTRRKDFSVGDTKIYLPTEAGNKWEQTDRLIMSDSRFPNGYENLNLEYKYDRSRCVLFPDFLLSDDVTALEIQNFYKALGVSLYICKEHKQFSEEYINSLELSPDVVNLRNSIWKDCDKRNYSYIADMDILSKLSLNSLLTLLLTPEFDYYNEVCDPQMIHWFKYSYKTPVKAEVSFASYLLRTESKAEHLKYYAVEDDEWLPGMKPDGIKPFGTDYRTKQLLIALGAKKHLADFTPAELYGAVVRKAEEARSPYQNMGIRTFYHKIKQALDSKDDLKIPQSLRMFCTIGERVEIRESREIFYSDNNSLPENLSKELPLLQMNGREGEASVSKCFGCRTFKDIFTQFTLTPNENEFVTEQLNRKIRESAPYFLAFVSEDIGTKGGVRSINLPAKNALGGLTIRVVSAGKYRCSVASEFLCENELSEGDLIFVDNKPVICSTQQSLSRALENPKFCNSIVEAICIILRLSVKENNDRFYRLIRSNQAELDYIRQYEIDSELWQSCQEALGISDKELEFWELVFNANNKSDCFDPDKIKEEKNSYISKQLGITQERADLSNFQLYHIQQLKAARESYVGGYKIWLHNRLKSEGRDQQKQYLGNIDNFNSDDWLKMPLERNDQYLLNLDYHGILHELIKEKFNIEPDELKTVDSTLPQKLECYNYDGLELDIEDESLLYFEGNEEYFINLRNKYKLDTEHKNTTTPTENPSNNEGQPKPVITPVDAKRRSGSHHQWNSGNRRGKGRTRRKLSDEELKKIGDAAEDMVFKALAAEDSGYEVGNVYSKHLNPESGNDAQGYDLEYRRKGEEIYRCLEIKHFGGESIMVSRREYEVARSKEYTGRYDIALVAGNEIQIWENAFSDESKYTIMSDGYTISFQTEHKKTN